MLNLTITGPADATIAISGRPVVFMAVTDPPNLATKVAWTVTGQPAASGHGGSFTHTFGETGVEQVVARIADAALACDVIVYVFATPSGGSTVADLLQATPPPNPRSAESFVRYGTHASAIGRAS